MPASIEIVNGRPIVRLPGGLYAALTIDPANSSPELAALLGSLGGGSGARVGLPLTGGTDGCLVVQTSPTTVVDANIFAKSLLRSGPLLLKVKPGEYYRLEGLLPLGITAAEAGANFRGVIVLAPKVNGRNWRILPLGASGTATIPTDLDPTLDPRVMLVVVGKVWSEGVMLADPQRPLGDNSPEAQFSFFEDFSSLTAGAAPPATMLQEQWVSGGIALTYDSTAKALNQVASNESRHALGYLPAGKFLGGSVRTVTSYDNVTGRRPRAYLAVQGLAAKETGWTAQLENLISGSLIGGGLSLYAYVDGGIVANTGAVIVTPNFVVGTQYVVEINGNEDGSLVRARAYIQGSAVPDWQRQSTAKVITTPGYAGIMNHGAANGGQSRYHSVAVSIGDLPLRSA